MEKILWIAEKESQLSQGVFPVLSGHTSERGAGWTKHGNDWCVWLDGHAFQQATPDDYLPDDLPKTGKGRKIWRMEDLPIIPPEQHWKILPDPRKRPRLSKLKELLAWCDVVYHLGDPDSEGQSLVDEALEFFRCRKPVKRVLINDYNPSKVREALANIRDNSDPLFRGWRLWGLARSRYDWLLGMNGTRAMTLRGRDMGHQGLLPVGSVQSPLLYVVRERDRAIETFKPVPYQDITAVFAAATGVEICGRWMPQEDQIGLDESGRLVDEAVAQQLLARLKEGVPGEASVIEHSVTDKRKKPPLPLSMNELQMEGFSRFGYTGDQVMEAAQKLYDTYKVMTYPRTDVRFLSEAHHAEAPGVIAGIIQLRPDLQAIASELDPLRKSAAFNDAKMRTPTGEPTPHHGIIPSIPENPVHLADWSEAERNVYDMVVRAYLAQFAADYQYRSMVLRIRVQAGEVFGATGVCPTAQGWKAVYKEPPPLDGAPAEEEGPEGDLPELQSGDLLRWLEVNATGKVTTAPPRFDDNMLLDAMKNLHRYVDDVELKKRLKEGEGIGTTATRAGIIADMKKRGMFVPAGGKGKKLMTSPEARSLIDALPMRVKDPAQAGAFKRSLDQVADGAMSLNDFMRYAEEFVRGIVDNAKEASITPLPPAVGDGVPCPNCKSALQNRGTRTVCTSCKFTLWHEVSGKTLTPGQIELLLTKGETPVIKGFVSRQKQSKFSAKLKLDACTGKTTFVFDSAPSSADRIPPSAPPMPASKLECPRCAGEIAAIPGHFECTACQLKVGAVIASRPLSATEVNALFSSGMTEKLSGFLNRDKRSFTAHLKLNRDSWKVEFDFGKKVG